MQLKGPGDYYAQANWHITWYSTYADTASGACRIATTRVTLKTTYTMPRWTPPATAPAELVPAWSGYMSRLWLHERGHNRNGLRTARRIHTLIRNARPRSTCTQLGNAVNGASSAQIKVGQRADVSYDATTGHGATQGAVWP